MPFGIIIGVGGKGDMTMPFGVETSDVGTMSDFWSGLGELILDEQQLLAFVLVGGLGIEGSVIGAEESSSRLPPPQHEPPLTTGSLASSGMCGVAMERPCAARTGLEPSELIMGGGICG